VQDNLQRYLKKNRFPTEIVTFDTSASAVVEVRSSPAAAMDAQDALANLLVDLGRVPARNCARQSAKQ
jgi:hypothetical protein